MLLCILFGYIAAFFYVICGKNVDITNEITYYMLVVAYPVMKTFFYLKGRLI